MWVANSGILASRLCCVVNLEMSIWFASQVGTLEMQTWLLSTLERSWDTCFLSCAIWVYQHAFLSFSWNRQSGWQEVIQSVNTSHKWNTEQFSPMFNSYPENWSEDCLSWLDGAMEVCEGALSVWYLRCSGFTQCLNLQNQAKKTRVHYCQWFQQIIQNVNILDQVFFRDGTWFHLTGYVNNENSMIWSTTNPQVSYELSLQGGKTGMLCAVSHGALLFRETVIAESYQELTTQLNSLLDETKWNCWLQQDHATAHDKFHYGNAGRVCHWRCDS